ncbi:MAG: HAD family phosphatase [Cyclobacteriaceae bacterium]|nr:HAD family phosphatase [Cyclobacteriaceae bacterium]
MKGVIFDMDGTMVDNMMVHHRAWQRKLASLGFNMTIKEVMNEIHGVNEEIIERIFGDRFTPEQRRRIAWEKEQEYRDIYVHELQPIPGLMSFLNTLQDESIPLAIATAAPPENVDLVLDNLNIRDRFESIVHSGNVTNGKPHPEVYRKSALNLQVPVQECLVIEDSVIGAQTALNAGSPAIIITTTHSAEEFNHFPHIIRFIDDYQDLTTESIQRLL